ncbi:hypothetical protein HHK36_033204 [Tetracentron sinense]|uniref:Uncharacterized protein n=1 Tax=Tetracentron sinense TaxID=13715 RepID=A0A835CWZ1_TETSI|nr:hypothetical protein HHK36_033204 [Tetracentron sinense]
MYVTRHLSIYSKYPVTLSIPPPEAPYSGYLIRKDEESEAEDTCCWGAWKNTRVRKLPFPQNKILTVVHSSGSEEDGSVDQDKVLFIPVLDLPLSSNRYYVIRAKGRYKGQACTCSREDDMGACCFCDIVKDVKPRALDYRNTYQQVEIRSCRHGGFAAKSVAPDGFPPLFLRRKGWELYTSSSQYCKFGEAAGLDVSVRMHLPEFDFPLSDKHSTAMVAGKWYCPFLFVKEGTNLRDQMKNSMFYEMTLEQRWEEIYMCENESNDGNAVVVNVSVQREVASVFGEEAVIDDTHGIDGVMWLRSINHLRGNLRVGLSLAIVEKMRWVQEKGGWVDGEDRDVKVERIEEFEGEMGWKRFGCYVLVESFVLRRIDGSLLLTWDFRHTHRIQSKWE